MPRVTGRLDRGSLLVLGTGMISGAFLSRLLAENPYHQMTVFYHPIPTLFLVGIVTFVVSVPRLVLWRRGAQADVLLHNTFSHLPLLLLALYVFQREVDTLKAGVLLGGSLLLTLTLNLLELLKQRWIDKAVLATLFIVPFALYWMTLAPTVGEHDTFELQVLSYELGIAHPTGYPLYIMIGKLFTLLPFGNVAYRVNLSSAFFAATAVVAVYGIVYHLTAERLPSALAALTFAFSYSFWSQAVIAEVYALNALFVAVTCYLVLRCFGHTAPVAQEPQSTLGAHQLPAVHHPAAMIIRRKRLLTYATSLTYGLSLTHHRTMLLLAPAIIAYVFLTRPWRFLRLRDTALSLIAFVTPLVGIHLYIPLRWWQMHGQSMTYGEFTNLVLGSQFAAALRWTAWLQDPGRLVICLRILLEQYPLPALALALLGFTCLLWTRKPRSPGRHSKEGLFLLFALFAYAVFGLSYYVPDVSLFLIPCYLIIAAALGVGVARLCQLGHTLLGRVERLGQKMRRSLIASAGLTLFAVLPLGLIWSNVSRVDRSQDYASYEWGRYVLHQALPQGAVILADSEKIAPLYYLQRVEGMRPDTETGIFPDEESNKSELSRRLSEGRPVLLARFLPGLEHSYHLRSLGPLVEVSPYALTELPPDACLSRDIEVASRSFEERILLRGYCLDSAAISAKDPLRLTLYWQAVESMGRNYEVRLRLTGSTGHIWHQTKGRPPVNGLYPTAAWRAGEIIPDFHEIQLEDNVPPGTYTLQVGLFRPFSRHGLVSSAGEEDYVALSRIVISPATDWAPRAQHSRRANFGNRIVLMGYDLRGTVRPMEKTSLTLYWKRIGPVSTDYRVVLTLATANGDMLWQSIESPFFGEYASSHWPEHQVLPDTHQIAIPDQTSTGLVLKLGLEDPESRQPVPVIDGWQAGWHWQTDLATLRVEDLPSAAGEEDLPANFENQVLLVDSELGHVQVRRGEALQITLTWEGLTPMDEDYTVFVHLLDENDRIWGQEDIQPARGTYPTSQWSEGDMVADPHTVWTDQHSPLGLYYVEVGLYLLRTMERLQVLDASGKAVSDRVLIGPVEIVP